MAPVAWAEEVAGKILTGAGAGCIGDGAACTAPTDCVCTAGWSGTISSPSSKCTACAVGHFKKTADVALCAKCPTDSTTKAVGAVSVDLCLCAAGHSGIINSPTDKCTACAIGQYDDGKAVTASCTSCPTVSIPDPPMTQSAATTDSLTCCVCSSRQRQVPCQLL